MTRSARRSRLVLLPCLALAIASCAHGPTVEGPPTIGRSTEGQPLPELPRVEGGPPMPWDEMSHDDQRRYMSEHVVPAMKPMFQAFDPERYEDFSCGTCHARRSFEMPNASLPVLPVPESEGWNAMMRDRRHVYDFMAERVEVAMAALLGRQPYDPATREGFGCFDCHTMEEP